MDIQTPDWVKQAVFYQIFPDRFYRRPGTPPPGIDFKPWGTPPEEQGFQGGDLYGVIDKLDYLHDLGVNALYLNPIFAAPSNHRYNTYDYLQVDPLLGGDAALHALLDAAHRRGMRVVLDGVFNHCGRGFWAFQHLLENGGNSPYRDWFTVLGYPLNPYPDGVNMKNPNYIGWWGHASLPKLNIYNPGVRAYLLHVTRYWLEFGMDGWRLDVPEDIQDDEFWREFRQVVKATNPQAYIVGEIWHEANHWLKGDMFDAVMNYQFTGPTLSFFGAADLQTAWRHPDIQLKPGSAPVFKRQIKKMLGWYDWNINTVQMNMLDSHDMPRALWLLRGDKTALCLAVLCQMTMPGAPNVYYGDEIGLAAAGDPYCREAFPWGHPENWDHELHAFYKEVIALRRSLPALQTGSLEFLHARKQVIAYRRQVEGQQVVVVAFNAGQEVESLHLSGRALGKASFRQAWPTAEGTVWQVGRNGLDLALPPQSGRVLVTVD